MNQAEPTLEVEGADAGDQVEEVQTPADAAAEKKLTEREQALADISARIRAERDAEAGTAAEPAPAPIDGEQTQAAAPTDQDLADSPVFQRDGKWLTRVKVDGVEQEISFDEFRALTQKNLAVDARMRKAAEVESALRGKALLLEQEEARIKSLATAKVAKPDPAPSTDVPDPKQFAKGIVSKIFSGDEDAAVEMLSTVIQGRQPTTPQDFDGAIAQRIKQLEPEIVRRAAEKASSDAAMAANKAELRKSLARFNSKHPEIAGNHILNEVANLETARIIKEKTNLSVDEFVAGYDASTISFDEIWEETSKRVAAHMGRTDDRTARKRQISDPAVGVTATVPVAPDKVELSREESRQRALDQIRKARGQS